MKAPRATVAACLTLVVVILAGAGALWLWEGGKQGSPATQPPSASVTQVAGTSQMASPVPAPVAPAPPPAPPQCERYLHASNLDAGCLEPSGSLTATVGPQTLDTTGTRVTCQLEGNRLEVSVDTLERLQDQGAFWAVLWGQDTSFDVLEMGIGYGRSTPDGDPAPAIHYRKSDSADATASIAASRDGRALTLTGTLPRGLGESTLIPFTMSVTCPADF